MISPSFDQRLNPWLPELWLFCVLAWGGQGGKRQEGHQSINSISQELPHQPVVSSQTHAHLNLHGLPEPPLKNLLKTQVCIAMETVRSNQEKASTRVTLNFPDKSCLFISEQVCPCSHTLVHACTQAHTCTGSSLTRLLPVWDLHWGAFSKGKWLKYLHNEALQESLMEA